jgi:hypothetical protein
MTQNVDDSEVTDAYGQYLAVFDSWNMVAPIVPAHVRPYLQVNYGDPLFLSTLGSPVPAEAGYMLAPLRDGSPVLEGYVSNKGPDYFVSYGRDNGYSAMWGFAARAGGVFVSVQTVIGQADLTGVVAPDNDGATSGRRRRFDLLFEAYNEHLAPVLDRGTRPVAAGVVCGFRGFYVIAREERSSSLRADSDDLPTGWVRVADGAADGGPWMTPKEAGRSRVELRAALEFAAAAKSMSF